MAPFLLSRTALDAWRSYRRSHAVVGRERDTRLRTEHAITRHAYEALWYLVERIPCGDNARVSYAKITDAGVVRLVQAEQAYTTEVNRLLLERFSETELCALAGRLRRLPGACGKISRRRSPKRFKTAAPVAS